ncbi:SOS response-associated peptidase [Candidatus Woesearchaeota archaeon]|nr:SOS response-associated peptidase [Candidatus Woesearchaeota archaeon]
MCGRFSLAAVGPTLADFFNIRVDETLKPRYNIAPTQQAPVITGDKAEELIMMRWGLIPGWAKEIETKYSMINARAETLTSRPAYKKPFQSQRCLVPADGFYEWRKTPTAKIPYRITLRDNGLFAFAGIFDIWKDEEGREIKSFTIITVPPNSLVRELHNRMPAILRREHEKLWLHSTAAEKLIEIALKPYPSEKMKAYQISPLVNSPSNDSFEIIKPAETKTLFDY